MRNLFHTVRYLRPVQVVARLRRACRRPGVARPASPRLRPGCRSGLRFARRAPCMTGPATFTFLNETRELSWPAGWNDRDAGRLWLYNLHYFEDLLSEGRPARAAWHRALIARWIDDNPPFTGVAWEPYPVSMRLSAWIRWALEGNELEAAWRNSLALQAAFLYRHVEWHLLGNHVFENARALTLAGLFFEGDTADCWLRRGRSILARQLDEQILADGGHFERSPMYHALVLEGLLDLIQVSEAYGQHPDAVRAWRVRAGDMLGWLAAMTHVDGDIAFFNDAALGVSLPPAALTAYAARLGIAAPRSGAQAGLRHLATSGYIRAERGDWSAILDAAALGPDFQPGHGHADTLSFELCHGGARLLVNSGTSVYAPGPERQRQRGTAAHNSVVVDGQDSSEVWHGFRVARRARPRDVAMRGTGDRWQVWAAHDGYRRLPGRVIHRRCWTLEVTRMVIADLLEGTFERAQACFHFHPAVAVTLAADRGTVTLANGRRLALRVELGQGALIDATYHPRFGVSLPTRCLRVTLVGARSRVVFSA